MTNPEITPRASVAALAGTFPGDLGVELVDIDDEQVRGRLLVDRRHLHPGGYVHAGVWTAFADTIAAWGTMRHLPEGRGFTTAELKVNVFAAGEPGDELTGVGKPLHVGRRTQVWEVRVYRGERPIANTEGPGSPASARLRHPLAANFICTQMVL